MVPNLADSQYIQIRNITLSNCPPTEIANIVGCSRVFCIYDTVKPLSFWLYYTKLT
jgi:hypothetical protein